MPHPALWALHHSHHGCFIATAAYGTPLAPDVCLLQDFRDRYLLKNVFGRGFISFYYFISPPIASGIERSAFLRRAVRIMLTPLILFIKRNYFH